MKRRLLTALFFLRVSTGLALVLIASASLPRAAEGTDPETFPPLPDPAALQPRSAAEIEAGAVILERVVQLSGNVAVKFASTKGWVRRRSRVRYLVLDAKGAEKLTRHSFFGGVGSGADVLEIRGRTVTAGGEEFPLDPQKDIRDMDIKDARGRTRKAGRTAFFPHVEPGAILDLAWSEKSDEVPALEVVGLQQEVPTRSLKVSARGLLLESSMAKSILLGGAMQQFYWVPFFVGPVPPRSRATLDEEFNLELESTDLDPAPEEPAGPPAIRTTYSIGLIPQGFALTKKGSTEDWHRNLVLFGSPETLSVEKTKTTITRDLDPGEGMIRLDDLGLQISPDWGKNETLMAFFQGGLKGDHDYIVTFLKKATGVESREEIEAIAPASLPWKERARRLYEHVRARVRPDPNASLEGSLAKVLKEGVGSRLDVSLYFLHLAREAGIPARDIFAFPRFGIAFQPVVDSWRPFGPSSFIEVGPPGEPPLYLCPGDPFANFDSFNDRYLGALAFRQPDGKDDPWSLVRLPADLPISETSQVALSSPIPLDSEPVDLTLHTTLSDSAAMWFRWGLGWHDDDKKDKDREKHAEERKKAAKSALEGWLDAWTGLELKGELPELNPMQDPEKPFSFELNTTWTPEIQDMSAQLLVPALPKASHFVNEFVKDERGQPIWLPGGRFEVSFTWRLPAAYGLLRTPPRAERSGPGGLSYVMEVTQGAPQREGEGASVTTQMLLTLPRMLPATEYAGVKEFYQDLQKTADTRLLISKGGE